MILDSLLLQCLFRSLHRIVWKILHDPQTQAPGEVYIVISHMAQKAVDDEAVPFWMLLWQQPKKAVASGVV